MSRRCCIFWDVKNIFPFVTFRIISNRYRFESTFTRQHEYFWTLMKKNLQLRRTSFMSLETTERLRDTKWCHQTLMSPVQASCSTANCLHISRMSIIGWDEMRWCTIRGCPDECQWIFNQLKQTNIQTRHCTLSLFFINPPPSRPCSLTSPSLSWGGGRWQTRNRYDPPDRECFRRYSASCNYFSSSRAHLGSFWDGSSDGLQMVVRSTRSSVILYWMMLVADDFVSSVIQS